MMIKVESAFYKYPGAPRDVIQDISFTVRKGEIFGFLGPSGAGKSTLQKILTGVLRDYQGRVQVLGTEMKHRKSSFYEGIGVDFEFPNFYGKFTALENLQYFASLYHQKTLDPLTLLEQVGLQHDAHKRVASYSKGMKMRLGFVRCLLHNPQLLFLDEPTSGLDPANARILKDMMLEQKAGGKTIILTTHNMHDAGELCDRVAFIVDGKIRALNTPQAFQVERSSSAEVNYSYRRDGRTVDRRSTLTQLGQDDEFVKALQNGSLLRIHSKERTLEEVFIALTGRQLQ
ncbi:Fluoroquinolones export ATP-binding protein [bioreactor metagenome]|uniref:Fluoroquinolones export ATP-binding protein Rv2688c/MT2762 n=2 Tax=root TaxID=1 RepID=A0A098B405_DESHA|nr:ABC transporter ATP-binding protein [Desulfitobacterium hafniense]MEA5022905.1 ABC transporter ATP-binding protein [Desulfitobacterium hafniense]CDX03608.1 Fluoroquinolones export ATP-binding protein Rv2688c/MT2762 [Desulfitobacterium hafniense]